MDLQAWLEGARRSRARRWMLDQALRWMIPFNRPHGLRVTPLPAGGIRVDVPYWRINRNHIKGIHACCLATAAEYCSGLALMEHLDAKAYRLIMKELRMQYHYQARAAAHAVFAPGAAAIEAAVVRPLVAQEAVLYEAEVPLHDRLGNHLATGRITWQVKAWSSVRTKV